MSGTGGRRLRIPVIRSPQDFVAGLVFLAIAIAAFVLLMPLGSGRIAGLGPATAPRIFAIFIGAISLLVLVPSFSSDGPPLERVYFRAMALIVGGIVVFAYALPVLGFVVTGILVSYIAAWAAPDVRPLEALLSAVVLTGFCLLLFRFALGLPLPLFPWFLQ